MEPLYCRSIIRKDAGPPRQTHHHKCKCNDMKLNKWDVCGGMVEWNLWQDKTGESVKKHRPYPHSVSSTTKPIWIDQEANSDPSGGRRASNRLCHEVPVCHNGGDGWFGFPDLWSGHKPWWNWYLTPVVNFGTWRLARRIKWTACDAEAKEGLENELWRRWSNGRVGEWAVT